MFLSSWKWRWFFCWHDMMMRFAEDELHWQQIIHISRSSPAAAPRITQDHGFTITIIMGKHYHLPHHHIPFCLFSNPFCTSYHDHHHHHFVVCFDVREKRNARQRLARVLSCNNAMNYKVSKNVQTTIFRTATTKSTNYFYSHHLLYILDLLGLIWSRYNGFHMQGQCQAEWKKIILCCDDFLVGCLKENKRTRRKYKAHFYLQASFRNAMTVVIVVIIISELFKCACFSLWYRYQQCSLVIMKEVDNIEMEITVSFSVRWHSQGLNKNECFIFRHCALLLDKLLLHY